MKLSIVIVSYNVRDYLHQCLQSVEKAVQGIKTEIFVVDNCSQDDSVAYLRTRHPQVHYIENKENVGFARANNMAIRRSKGKYILLLNPDTIVCEDTLRECVRFMDAHPKAGSLGVKMLKVDGSFALESRRGIPTPFTAFCKMSGLCRWFPQSRRFGRYYMQYLDKEEVNEIEAISGAFMFLRRNALNESGFLDEDFFMYGEDIDLSFRILKRGWKNYYLPVPILHYKGESTQKSTYRYVYNFYRAMLIFFHKHYGHYGLLYALPFRFAIWGRGFLAYLNMRMRKRFDERKETIRFLQAMRYLFVGDAADYQMVRQLMTGQGFEVQWAEWNDDVAAKGHVACGAIYDNLQPHYVIYNAERHSYTDILRYFQASAAQTGKKVLHPQMALFYPSQNKMIVSTYIME